ncbi:hypothetical protein CDAR_492821, partial [Caerostris darwini]
MPSEFNVTASRNRIDLVAWEERHNELSIGIAT